MIVRSTAPWIDARREPLRSYMNVDWIGGSALGSSICEYAYTKPPPIASTTTTGTAMNTHQNRRKKPFFGFPFLSRVCLGV